MSSTVSFGVRVIGLRLIACFMVVAVMLPSLFLFDGEFFASLAEAHTHLYFCFLVNLNARLKFFIMVAHGFRGCSF